MIKHNCNTNNCNQSNIIIVLSGLDWAAIDLDKAIKFQSENNFYPKCTLPGLKLQDMNTYIYELQFCKIQDKLRI